MKTRELANLGYEGSSLLSQARAACAMAAAAGVSKRDLRTALEQLQRDPDPFLEDPLYGALARSIAETRAVSHRDPLPETGFTYACFGTNIERDAHRQMENACRLPISVLGALMPDAHVGYGLPIGGVLATEGAVIPYAVGVDIACRVMVSVLDLPVRELSRDPAIFRRALENETKFGTGGEWRERRSHDVMDADWSVSEVTRAMKDRAWRQLGTSGSGNHFVEFGELELHSPALGLEPDRYLALVSHSGSRGAGAKVASHFTAVAQSLHRKLPRELKQLAWLPLDGDGAEYWAAMELMGRYASANHQLIHHGVTRAVGARVRARVENHHNFAWKERHGGREVVVHRKGATPAGEGVLGYIPGTMVAPGFLVQGTGNESALSSAAHGAGRRLSRKAAVSSVTRHDLRTALRDAGVELLSAGLDEAPQAYKDIHEVMNDQRELVRVLGSFQPRIVKMAPDGERPED